MKSPVALLIASLSLPLMAQSLTSGLQQTYEVQYAVSQGRTPLWLNANRYGLSSLKGSNGYVRGRVERPMADEASRRWDVGYCADLAVPMGYTSHLVVQQLYAEVRYKHGVLTVGQKEQPMAFESSDLSTGAQTLGINARPVPGVRLALPRYYDIPGLRGWLGIKGHLSYGLMTDGDWQEQWTRQQSHYAQDVWLHTKAGYLRIGREEPRLQAFPLTLELGLEMAAQFGGTMYHTSYGTVHGTGGLKGALQALTATGSDEADPTYHNVAGNQLGSWVARLSYDAAAWRASAYVDHYFEDHSAMFFLDYDGYGTGDAWDDRVKSRYLAYPLRDMLVGLDVELKSSPWLRHVVLEYLDTRYQSGPIYHDHNTGISDHIGGDDNYYNHLLYQGWSHWGQVMGNPLYRSPLYNKDHTLTIQNNRSQAWHLGAMGQCAPVRGQRLDYRMLLTWQSALGTYQSPLLDIKHNFSLLAEATWSPIGWGPDYLRHASLRLAFGMDRGAVTGNNTGLQTSIIVRL